MAKRKKPDIVLKDYWRQEERFADLCNAVLFQGRQVIAPEDLQEMDADASEIVGVKGEFENLSAARDLIKLFRYAEKYHIVIAILGLENQELIHYAMPLRVMDYDVRTYMRQYRKNARRYNNSRGLTEEEFLSGMRKTDKFIPVISIVVYYGEKAWDGAKTLKEMLDVPERLDAYINDYQMNLVEVRENNLPLKNRQNRELFQICGILYDKAESMEEKKQRVMNYTEKNQIDHEVIVAAMAITGKTIQERTGGKQKMWSFWKEFEKEYKEEGIKEGKKIGERKGKEIGAADQIVKMGKEFGLSDGDILQRLQTELQWSLEYAGDYLKEHAESLYQMRR